MKMKKASGKRSLEYDELSHFPGNFGQAPPDPAKITRFSVISNQKFQIITVEWNNFSSTFLNLKNLSKSKLKSLALLIS